MALTVAQLLNAIRAAPEGEVVSAQLTAIGTRLLAVGRALVDTYAPLAPEDVRDEAVIRVAGYLYDAPNVTRSGVAWNESGARALVDPWVQRGVAPVDFDLADVAAATGDGGQPVDEEAVEAIVRRILAEQPPSAPASTVFEQIGSNFVFNASGTTSVDSGLVVPAAGWVVLDFDNGRSFWINAAQFRALGTSNPGRHLTGGEVIALPDANNVTDFWIGRSANNTILIANQDGTGTLGFTLYRVRTAAAASGGGLTQAQVDARIGARVEAWATQGSGDTPAARDLADNPQVGQVLKAASDGDAEWANESGGLTQAQVDARVAAVEGPDPATWAEDGNTDQIPLNKLGNAPSGGGGGLTQAQVDARVQAGVANWAEEGNQDDIPADKLGQELDALDRATTAGGWEARSGDLQISGPQSTRRNANQATAASYTDTVTHGTRRQNWYVIVRVANSLGNDPTKFRLNIDDDLYQSLAGLQEIANSANAMWYYFEVQIANLPGGAVVTPQYDEPVELSAETPPKAGDVRYDASAPSNLERWTGAAWQDIPAPAVSGGGGRSAGLRELHNGVMPVPTLVDLTGNRYSNTQVLRGNAALAQGILEVEASVQLNQPTVPVNLSFSSEAVERTARQSTLISMTDLRRRTPGLVLANRPGVGLLGFFIYSGAQWQGSLILHVAISGPSAESPREGNVYMYMEYRGQSGAVSGSGSFSANVVADFQHSDDIPDRPIPSLFGQRGHHGRQPLDGHRLHAAVQLRYGLMDHEHRRPNRARAHVLRRRDPRHGRNPIVWRGRLRGCRL